MDEQRSVMAAMDDPVSPPRIRRWTAAAMRVVKRGLVGHARRLAELEDDRLRNLGRRHGEAAHKVEEFEEYFRTHHQS